MAYQRAGADTGNMERVGRRKLELSPEVDRELTRARRRRDRAETALWAAVARALEAGESQAAVARALGITRQAVADRVRRAGPGPA